MNTATIEGCRAKLDRADAAIKEFHEKWLSWVDANPYPSRVEIEPATGHYLLFYDFSKAKVPHEFPVRFGEIAHDLRSALDHLVWREAIELLGREPTDEEANRIHFPIWSTRKRFKSSGVKRFVSNDSWTIIERHQPYDRGKAKRSKALELIHWLNRVDKHRFIPASEVFLARTIFQTLHLITWNPTVPLLGGPIADGATGRELKRETQIAYYVFDTTKGDPDVRVKGTPPLSISLGKMPRRIRSVSLSQASVDVRKVVDDFAATIPE